MKQKDEHALLLAKKEGIPYSKAYNEMLIIRWATGLSFSDYIKYDLHSVDPNLRFRAAERIRDRKHYKIHDVKEISKILNIKPKEVWKRIQAANKKYKGILFITVAIYHDYELYKMDEAGFDYVVNTIAERKISSDRFREILNGPDPYGAHISELEELYGKIKELNSKILTQTFIKRYTSVFSAVYPQMASDEAAARDITLDFLTLRNAAGYNHLNYKLYDMYNKPLIENLAFVSKREKADIVNEFNDPSARFLLDDKYSCYLKFRQYFKRDIISIRSTGDFLKVFLFCRKHPVFIKKPKYSQQGKGIRKVNVKDYKGVSDMISKVLQEDGEFIAEEILTGHPSTSIFNKDSLNTVRILTFNAGSRLPEEEETGEAFSRGLVRYAGNGVYCMAPFFKTGRAGFMVDNAGSGGVFSAVSLTDGSGSEIASDEEGRTYTVHPDSEVPFGSLKFDNFDKAVAIVAELALKIPDAKFIGWDLALTDKGEWALIEANFSPTFIGQAPARTGIYEALHKITMLTEKSSE